MRNYIVVSRSTGILQLLFRFVEFELSEDAAAAIDNMNDAELFGRTVRVNFARPPKVNERSQRPIWADDEWLKKYGQGSGQNQENDEKVESSNAVEGQEVKTSQKLPRVYFGIKIGIRFISSIF